MQQDRYCWVRNVRSQFLVEFFLNCDHAASFGQYLPNQGKGKISIRLDNNLFGEFHVLPYRYLQYILRPQQVGILSL